MKRRSEHALWSLGLPTALDDIRRMEQCGQGREAEELRRWLNLDLRPFMRLLTPSRQLRLAMCGVAFVTRCEGVVGAKRRGCKDRMCPVCSARRSRVMAARLREYTERRRRVHALATMRGERRPSKLWSFTFTRPKDPEESPRQALDGTLRCWRNFMEYHARDLLVGGMRSLEVTALKAGTAIVKPDGTRHVVRESGTHAHLHCILELCDGVSPEEVVGAWLASADGALDICQKPRELDTLAVYQACKYPVDMSTLADVLTVSPSYVRAVIDALAGRRMVATFGQWRELDLAREPAGAGLEFGSCAIVTLATSSPDGHTVRWLTTGDETPAEEVLAALLDLGSGGDGRLSPSQGDAPDRVGARPGLVGRAADERAQVLRSCEVGGVGSGGAGVAAQAELGYANSCQ